MKQTGKKTKAPRAWNAEALLQQMSAMKAVLGGVPVDAKNLGNQCLLLSKILDSLVAANEKPSWRQELLTLVRQVCKYKDNAEARPSLLVLLLSVKSAFRTGWLHGWMQVPEIDEIFGTLKMLFDNFTTPSEDKVAQPTRQYLLSGGAAVPNPGDLADFFSHISHRYYPRLKIISGFAALEAKAGYEVLMCDFHVPHMNLSDRVRLYVACKDNVETSACLVTPPQVNFLVNGKQVEKRVTVGYMDGGPQMPTDITRLVKVGANILQVIGEFSCPYVIAVASATNIPISAANSHLQDYVPPTTKTSNEDAMEVDDEVVEGASRVSLRCPVSHQRLATPVKAASCRHLQCFDYDSFLEINEKRPAWRCPCCNRSISWPELQIDRQMEKVLKEADEKVVEVIISQDGSWEAALSVDDKGASGTDVASTVDTIENGRDVIDLYNVDNEELNDERYNNVDIQPPERKPDVQFLQAVIGNRERTSTSAVPTVVVQQENSRSNVNERSGHLEFNNLPDITATAVQASLGTTGPLWSVPNRNVGAFLNVNDSNVVGRSTSMERLGQSQPGQQPAIVPGLPTPSQMSQFLNLHSRTGVHVSSPGGPLNSLASTSGHPHPAHMQQQQNTFSSEAGLLIQDPTGVHMRQRQVGQQVSGMAQDFGQARQQWQVPHPQQRQTGPLQPILSNVVQTQSIEQHHQLLANQGHFSYSQQAHSPRSASQQQPGARVAFSSGWPSGSPNIGSVLGPGPGPPLTPEHNWRPAARMRGSITPPVIGRGVGPSSTEQLRPSGGTATDNIPGISGVSPPLVVSGAYAGGSNTRPPLQGTTGNAWVSTSDLQTVPVMLNGVNTTEGWMNFEKHITGTHPESN